MTAILKTFLKLVRAPNLLFIACIQLFLWFFMIRPLYNYYDQVSALDPLHIILLALSTILIAAGGYVINDIQDVGMDLINKPDEIVISRDIRKKRAYNMYYLLTFWGLFLGLYVGYRVGDWKLGIIHFIIAGLLWFYASGLKKTLLIGNMVVAFASALVVLIIGLYEVTLHPDNILFIGGLNAKPIYHFILVYSFFAFVMTLIREIVKDLEDIKGDEAFGSHSLPISKGIRFSKMTVAIVVFGSLCALGYLLNHFFHTKDWIIFYYGLVAVGLPLLIFVYFLFKSKTKSQYHKLSKALKVIMLIGILYIPLYYYQLQAVLKVLAE